MPAFFKICLIFLPFAGKHSDSVVPNSDPWQKITPLVQIATWLPNPNPHLLLNIPTGLLGANNLKGVETRHNTRQAVHNLQCGLLAAMTITLVYLNFNLKFNLPPMCSTQVTSRVVTLFLALNSLLENLWITCLYNSNNVAGNEKWMWNKLVCVCNCGWNLAICYIRIIIIKYYNNESECQSTSKPK